MTEFNFWLNNSLIGFGNWKQETECNNEKMKVACIQLLTQLISSVHLQNNLYT